MHCLEHIGPSPTIRELKPIEKSVKGGGRKNFKNDINKNDVNALMQAHISDPYFQGDRGGRVYLKRLSDDFPKWYGVTNKGRR